MIMESMNEVHDLYNNLIAKKNEFPEYQGDNPFERNINYLKNLKKLEIDSFIRHYVVAFKLLEPKMRRMQNYIFIKKAGGHILITDKEFKKVKEQWKEEVDCVLGNLNMIVALDKDIATEYELLLQDKERKIRNEYVFDEIIDDTIKVVRGKQLQLF